MFCTNRIAQTNLIVGVIFVLGSCHLALSHEQLRVDSTQKNTGNNAASFNKLRQLREKRLRSAWERVSALSQALISDDDIARRHLSVERLNRSFGDLCDSVYQAKLPEWWKDKCLRELSSDAFHSLTATSSEPEWDDDHPSVITAATSNLYRRLPSDVWIHSNSRDEYGQPVKSLGAVHELLDATPETQKAFNTFSQRTGVAISTIKAPGQLIVAVHSPLSISTYPIFCINDAREIVWRTDVGGQLLSTASGDDILHQVEILVTSHGYVVAGADSIRVYLIEIDRVSGNSDMIFNSRAEECHYEHTANGTRTRPQ